MENFKHASDGTGGENEKRASISSGTIKDWVVGRRVYKDVPVKKGDDAVICREPTNTHDPNALAVFKDNTLIGYLPATTAKYLAPLFDQKLLRLEGSLMGGDTADGCAPLRISVTLTNPRGLAAAAVVNNVPDETFTNVFAAWRDRSEYDLETLQKFCKTTGKSLAACSCATELLYRLLSDYCSEQVERGPESKARQQDESPQVAERRRMLFNFLKEEGYVPDVDGDGDIHFKYEGGHYYLCTSNPDMEYFRIIYPQFWSIDSQEEFERVLRAASHATQKTKVAKIFPVRDDTWASLEIFVDKPESIKPVFTRMMQALKCAIDTFANEMRRQGGNEEE